MRRRLRLAPADPLDLPRYGQVLAAAEGFLAIAVDNMDAAMRQISVQRGYDVEGYTLVCFGGAGGQHACRVAEALGVRRVMIQRLAGVPSAYGMGSSGWIKTRRGAACRHSDGGRRGRRARLRPRGARRRKGGNPRQRTGRQGGGRRRRYRRDVRERGLRAAFRLKTRLSTVRGRRLRRRLAQAGPASGPPRLPPGPAFARRCTWGR